MLYRLYLQQRVNFINMKPCTIKNILISTFPQYSKKLKERFADTNAKLFFKMSKTFFNFSDILCQVTSNRTKAIHTFHIPLRFDSGIFRYIALSFN